jgi:hypothetical protein
VLAWLPAGWRTLISADLDQDEFEAKVERGKEKAAEAVDGSRNSDQRNQVSHAKNP